MRKVYDADLSVTLDYALCLQSATTCHV